MATQWRVSMVVTEDKLNMVIDLFKGECTSFRVDKVEEHKNGPAVVPVVNGARKSPDRFARKPVTVTGPMFDIIRSNMRDVPMGTVVNYKTIKGWLDEKGYNADSYSGCMTNLVRANFVRRPSKGNYVRI